MTQHFPADEYPIEISKGADFEKVWTYFPGGIEENTRDWTDYTGRAQLRENPQSAEILLEFTVTLGSDGSIRISSPADETAELASGAAVWDLYITDPDGHMVRFLAGPAMVSHQVTHD